MNIFAIDAGSSSVRGVFYDAEFNMKTLVHNVHRFETDEDGKAILDPLKLQQDVEDCLDAAHASGLPIHAIAIATFVGNMMGIDDNGNPLTPIITYSDTRSAKDADLLKETVGSPIERTGCPIHTAYIPTQLHWLRRTQPALFEQVHTWADFGAYCYRQWFGTAVTSYSVASWSGLLNRVTLEWDHDWLELLQLDRRRLPQLRDFDNAIQGLSGEYARRWTRFRDIPFFIPVGDGAAAQIGLGAFNPSQLSLTVGTTAAVRRVHSGSIPEIPAGLWSYRIDRDHHLVGGATSEGGNIYRWALDRFRLPEDEDIEEQLLNSEPDSHGLTFLPLLAGERSPNYNPHAEGAVLGLRLSSTAIEILQAGLEGVALRLATIAELLSAKEATVIAGGNAVQLSLAFTQMLANALGQAVHRTDTDKTTARGLAIMGRAVLENRHWRDYPLLPTTPVAPEPQHVSLMQQARERQIQLYKRLWPTHATDT